jgi:hypothetical protein
VQNANVFYVPGEHDIYDGGAPTENDSEKYDRTGWYSFDQKCPLHWVGQRGKYQEGGLGTLGRNNLTGLKKT